MNILLHVCCANCTIYPVRTLRARNMEVTGYFFNHNIHPFQEYHRRLDTVREFSAQSGLTMIYREEYLLEEFLSHVATAPHSRCHYCYASRLEETARVAAAKGFAGFTTSLLYSRYQQHEMIRDLGEKYASAYGIPFIYHDFREGWREGIEASKAMGLYRQQYCGCIYSEKERYCPPQENRSCR